MMLQFHISSLFPCSFPFVGIRNEHNYVEPESIFFPKPKALAAIIASSIQRRANFLIGECVHLRGLSDQEARTLSGARGAKRQTSARSAHARATPGWPASLFITSWPARRCPAFALRAEVCRFAPLAPLSFLASRSLHPEVNTLPYEENCSSIELAI